MAPSKTPGQKDAASETFKKKEAQAHGLGAPNAPAHKEGHAPGEAPVASDSGPIKGSTNVPVEKVPHVGDKPVNRGNPMGGEK
ncbi:hypothetical protein GGR53DRAFT_514885 [Hypoxylon sp. FL1150]|nr:hypothetical protein GGR53DRAFT_514885 [Hypoxylon sp. FL1150]